MSMEGLKEVGEDVHPIFRKEPDEWMQYLNKQVSVLTEDGVEHVGLVYTIDPVSESYVLVNFVDDTTKLEIVLGHAITSVTIISQNTETLKEKLENLFRSKSQRDLSAEELKKRQSTLKSWLLKNRLPVEVSGVNGELLALSDALVIQPPYDADNCISTNEIILGKIQGLIKNMPPDQVDW